MKKLILIVLLFLVPVFVKANECNINSITIEGVSLEEVKGEAIEKSSPVLDGLNVNLDLKLTEVGDSVKYKITIKNDSDELFEFNKKNLVSNSDYLTYTFDNNSDSINAHEEKDIYITVKYNKKVNSAAFMNGTFNESKSVSNSLNTIDNPVTGVFDYNYLYIIIIVSICVFFISRKVLSKSYYFIFVFGLILIPMIIHSACKFDINVDSNIEIPEFEGRSLINTISDEAQSDEKIDFTIPSSDTNGKGVYVVDSTKNDENPIYYYRGEIDYNNVLFRGFCFKILRTTSEGGIKLIYSGMPNEGKCNNSGESTMTSTGVKYNGSGNIGYFGYASEAGHALKNIKITNITNGSVFAEDVTYEDGKYILSDERYIKDSSLASNVVSLLENHHYSCFKVEGQDCTTVNFVYMTRGGYLYYAILSNGEKIEDVLRKDVTESSNLNDSTAKTNVENWFRDNLNSYSSYIDDVVYCNDRSIGLLGGFDKNGSIVDTNKMQFSSLVRALEGKPSVKCNSKNDKFTVSDTIGNGKNKYPVGLITLDEAILAGFAWNQDDDTNYLYNGRVWWSMSPTLSSVALEYIGVLHSMADNVNTTYVSNGAGGIRPVIALKNSVKISGGNGTSDNPFTIATLK